MLYVVHHQVNIFFHIEQLEIFGMLFVFMCHAGTAYQLQLMHLQSGKRQAGQDGSLGHQFVMRLSRKSQYDVSTGKDATGSGTLDGIYRVLIGMPTINAAKRCVIGTFDAVFN